MLEYLLPEYEKNCLEAYVGEEEKKMVFRNEKLFDNVSNLVMNLVNICLVLFRKILLIFISLKNYYMCL